MRKKKFIGRQAPIDYPWHVGELPFVWGIQPEAINSTELPDRLPFTLYVDPQTGILSQASDERVTSALDRVYKIGSIITGVMEDNNISGKYGDDFINFLQASYGLKRLEGLRVLEIGTGTGYLLRRLSELGSEVLGLEPGEHGQLAVEKHNLPVIRDFFPTKRLEGTFDLIIVTYVLEHIQNPFGFLKNIKKHMHAGSRVAMAVPDCKSNVMKGDISMLIHEHWSYFTKQTLCNMLRLSCLTSITIEPSSYGSSLYILAELKKDRSKLSVDNIQQQFRIAERYKELYKNNAEKIYDFITQAYLAGQTIGIYVPSRIVNYMAIGKVAFSHCRFFDDNKRLHCSYFPSIPIRIESREALIQNPTDIVLLMSKPFGRSILKQLLPLLPESTTFVIWEELFG